MASFLYKDYLIVSAADCDRESLEWKPWVSICWRDDGRQNLHLIRFTHEKFQTAAEAETFGKSAGEKWVDEMAVGKKSSTLTLRHSNWQQARKEELR